MGVPRGSRWWSIYSQRKKLNQKKQQKENVIVKDLKVDIENCAKIEDSIDEIKLIVLTYDAVFQI